jgi:hypothetical protein
MALEDHAPVHLVSSFIFFLGCILDFFLGNNLTIACGFAVSTLSWLSFALFFAHMLTMSKGREIGLIQLLTIGALFQYGVALTIFLKIAVFGNDLPPQSVKLNREKGEWPRNDRSFPPFFDLRTNGSPPLIPQSVNRLCSIRPMY